MGIYGGGRRIITELGANEMPYGLALRHNNVYWTDWKKYVVQVFINVKNNTNNTPLNLVTILINDHFSIYHQYSKGIHGVTREMGERINTLPHMLSDMDKPYGLVALPNGCAEGKKILIICK